MARKDKKTGDGAATKKEGGIRKLIAVVRDTALLDSTGSAIGEVGAGAIGLRASQEPWNGRVLVRLPEGREGYLSLMDAGFEAAERY
jgi:hypothetical protein